MAQIRANNGGTVRTFMRIRVNDAGTVRTIQRIRVNAGGTVRTVFQFFNATASPTTLTRGGTSPSISSLGATAVPVGGTSPFTYLWTLVSDDGVGTWTIGTDTTPATNFTVSGLGVGDVANASFICTVTDAGGNTADTNAVMVTLSRFS